MAETIPDLLHGSDTEAAELCRLLGVDTKLVRRVVIDLAAGEVAIAYVELYTSRAAVRYLIESGKTAQVEIVEAGHSSAVDGRLEICVQDQGGKHKPESVDALVTRCENCGRRITREAPEEPWRLDP